MPGFKTLLLNYLINSGGTMITIGLTLAQATIALISKYDDCNLLETIHKVQVVSDTRRRSCCSSS